MTAQDLKNSILQLAMRGKLVEQRAEEGTARELIGQIELEKERLTKEGRLKKEKPLPKIAEEEIPYEIPKRWEWIRLGNCISLLSGQDMTPDKYNDSETGIPYLTGASNIVNGKIIINRWTDEPKAIATKGNLLITCKGTIGVTCILNEKEVHIARQIMAITEICVEIEYIHKFLQLYVGTLKKKAKSMIPGIERKDVLNAVVPLPPLSEQKRIVEKIEELLPYIDEYDKAYSKLEVLNKKFPEDMQKSILRYAMQGKLVEQKPEEGTADELYEQIVTEKARLIKEGKIKKEKFLNVITEDEIPYEIPDSWKWVSINDIAFVTKLAGFEYTKYMADTIMPYGEVPIVRAKNIKPNSFMENENEFITMELSEQLSRCALDTKCVLMTFIGAGIGEVAVFDNIRRNHLAPNVAKIVPYVDINYFLMYYLMSAEGQLQIFQYMKRTAQPSLSMEVIRKVLVPLPPLAEQKRIVQEIEEMMPYCKKLSQI